MKILKKYKTFESVVKENKIFELNKNNLSLDDVREKMKWLNIERNEIEEEYKSYTKILEDANIEEATKYLDSIGDFKGDDDKGYYTICDITRITSLPINTKTKILSHFYEVGFNNRRQYKLGFECEQWAYSIVMTKFKSSEKSVVNSIMMNGIPLYDPDINVIKILKNFVSMLRREFNYEIPKEV